MQEFGSDVAAWKPEKSSEREGQGRHLVEDDRGFCSCMKAYKVTLLQMVPSRRKGI